MAVAQGVLRGDAAEDVRVGQRRPEKVHCLHKHGIQVKNCCVPFSSSESWPLKVRFLVRCWQSLLDATLPRCVASVNPKGDVLLDMSMSVMLTGELGHLHADVARGRCRQHSCIVSGVEARQDTGAGMHIVPEPVQDPGQRRRAHLQRVALTLHLAPMSQTGRNT